MRLFKKQFSYKGMSDTIFRYEFLNETKEPIDFDNFTKTVEGMRELYGIFLKKQNIKYDIHSKLYIHKLKSGSSIIDLCNQFVQNNHEMFDYINVLLPQFCKYMVDFSSFLRGDGEKKSITEYSKQEYTAYQKFNSSIVADRGSKQNIKLINNGKIEIHIHQNYQGACTESYNAEKNNQALENKLIEIPFENEKLELYQPSQEQDNKKFLGNAGIVKNVL
jgi:hypothetical protein